MSLKDESTLAKPYALGAAVQTGGIQPDYAKLVPFYAALAGRNSARCTIAQIGDSITEGAYSSDFQSASTPGRLTQILRARFPTSNVVGGRGWIPASNYAPGSATPPVAVSGTSSFTKSSWSPNNQLIPMSQTAHSCTVTLTGTSFDLNYVTFSSAGIGYYQIDGGAQVTFNAYSASTVGNAKLNVPLTAGSHTVKVGWSSGGPIYFNGFTEYNQDENAGINVARFGLSGSDTADWLAASGLAAATATFSPSLIVIQHGTNDASTSYGNLTAAQYKANLLSMIASLRAAFTTPPPIILSLVYQPSTSAVTLREPWANYATAAKAIADSDSAVVFVDHSSRMPVGNAANTYGLYYSDGIHPSDRGYAFIAETLASVIAPR